MHSRKAQSKAANHRAKSMEHSPELVDTDAYYKQLAPFERRTCDIAREHLGSSFDLARSNGFLRWLAKKK
jgi:hypothetical protein